MPNNNIDDAFQNGSPENNPPFQMQGFNYDEITRDTLLPAMRPGGRLNPYAFACALSETLDTGIIPASPAALQEVLETDDNLVHTLNRFYPDDNAKVERFLGLDTQDRELVAHVLAKRFTNRGWPTFGDSSGETVKFLDALKCHLLSIGWHFRFRD